MSQCAALLQATDVEKKIAFYQLKAFAEEIAEQRAYQARRVLAKAAWQADIAAAELRAMEKVNIDFTLCKRCVVERPEEQVPE